MKKTLGKRIATFSAAIAVAATVFASASISSFAYTQTTGTVTSDNVKVRASASTTASQVSSLKNGDSVDIVDEATDSSGYVWYKIYVNKNEFGYVRSDLVNKKGGSSTASATSTQSAASLPETSVTATEQRTATVTSDSVNVRKGAGTAYESVGKVTKGGSVTITGEATGTDNKTWYQISFGDGKTGFVRSDLVEVSEAPVKNVEVTEGAEGENVEQAEGEYVEGGEQAENSDSLISPVGDGAYSLSYVINDEGNGEWFLNNYIDLQKVKVKDLIDYANDTPAAMAALKKSNGNLKKIVIVLAVLAVILVAGVVILALKLRDSLYYEDEEEEYDRYATPRKKNVEEEYPARKPARDENQRSVRTQDSEKTERPFRRNAEPEAERPSRRNTEERTVRPTRRNAEDEYVRRPSRRDADEEVRRPVRRSERVEEEEFENERPSRGPLKDAEERQARRQESRREAEKAAPKRKARNFVGDEDDFEFEFLDLDDDK